MTLKFAADEDFNHDIVRGLLRHSPDLDIKTVHDAGLAGSADPVILAWAADEGRVPLTHDVQTMTRHAYDRVRAGDRMPGVFEVPQWLSVGRAIEEITLIAHASRDGEWEGQVRYLPLA